MTEEIAARKDVLETLAASLQSERKWRNIQTVLPESFGLVAHALTAQSQVVEKLQQRIENLERALVTVATADQVAALEERIRVDTKRRVSRLRKEVSTSLDQEPAATQQLKEELELRLKQEVGATTKKIEQVKQNFEQRICKVEENLGHEIESVQFLVNDQGSLLNSARIAEEAKWIKLQQDLALKLEVAERKMAEAKTEVAVVPVVKEISAAAPEDKEVDMNALREDVVRVSQEVRGVETRMEKQLVCWRQDLMDSIGKKLCRSEMTKLLSRKMDTMDAWKQFAEKADSTRVEEVACALMDSIQRAQESAMDDIDQLRHLNETKADTLELVQVRHNMHNLLSVAESIQHELSVLKRVVDEKMTVSDVKELVNSQTTLKGLQGAIEKVESAAAGEFVTKSEFENTHRQVQAISRQLRSEIYQARYIWKDGRPSPKQTIQWTSQVVNTSADIFLWQFGSDEVRLLLPGLYHLQAAFFTNYSPRIQVLVNGEPAFLLRSPTATENIECSGHSTMRRLHHSAGNVAGISVDVFLALPAGALVAISYDLDEKAQGFLNLRKL